MTTCLDHTMSSSRNEQEIKLVLKAVKGSYLLQLVCVGLVKTQGSSLHHVEHPSCRRGP